MATNEIGFGQALAHLALMLKTAQLLGVFLHMQANVQPCYYHVIENTGYNSILLSLICPSFDLSLAFLTYMLVILSSTYTSIYLSACAGV